MCYLFIGFLSASSLGPNLGKPFQPFDPATAPTQLNQDQHQSPTQHILDQHQPPTQQHPYQSNFQSQLTPQLKSSQLPPGSAGYGQASVAGSAGYGQASVVSTNIAGQPSYQDIITNGYLNSDESDNTVGLFSVSSNLLGQHQDTYGQHSTRDAGSQYNGGEASGQYSGGEASGQYSQVTTKKPSLELVTNAREGEEERKVKYKKYIFLL